MKNVALIFLITIAFANCKSVDSQRVSNSNLKTETNLTKIEITGTPENLLKDLTKKQRQKLDERIPPKVREVLDKADEIYIYYNIDKENNGLRVLGYGSVPNAGATLSDASLKKRFLDSFYYDASSEEGGAMCFSPRHKITAKYNNKTVDIDICYQCKNFKGNSSYGTFGGGLAYEDKSSLIINEIIEKYGTDLQ
ncbi:MAG: hypothetical protein M3033_09905 [Acidobacteriota bacterium]|nr:hypothetical protein [Acidobacteriota bacterium]